SRRRHTRFSRDWSSDVCSSDLVLEGQAVAPADLPGVTGPWQVSGRNRLSFEDMVRLDIAYIESWSLGLDVKILLRTVPALFAHKIGRASCRASVLISVVAVLC